MAVNSKPVDDGVNEVDSDDLPPVLSSWNQIYAVVLILHAIIILLFYLFTHAYA
ncbi:MAG: hypothetical protein R2824_27745 [Saprospiraceae bacterium]|nr:hypothetical protein [Lewinella sp.]